MSVFSRLGGTGLRARAARSTIFTIVGFGGENALRLAGNLVLTRLLFPEAFGLMALVQVVMMGLIMFSDLGLRAAIIQSERGAEPAFLNTAWTLQIGRGCILWLATCLLASPVATFYQEPDLALMLPVAGLTAVFSGFESTRLATANRDLLLGRLTILTLGTQAFGLMVTISIALYHPSVWALVFGGLVAPFLKALLSHSILPGNVDRLAFESTALRHLLNFGRYIFLSTLATFLISHGDRAILGKFASLTELALYNIAFFLASVPLLLINKIAGDVLFPVLSKAPPGQMSSAVAETLRSRIWLTLGMILLCAVLAFGGDHLIRVLYDPRYETAGLLLILIALAQLPVLIESTYGPMPLAAGHSGRFAAFVVISALIRVIVLYFAASFYGIIGVALAPAVASLLFYPIMLLLTRRYHQWDLRADLVSALACGVVIICVVLFKADAFQEALKVFG